MASELTLFSDDGDWKVEIEAFKNNFLFYKSIGTTVRIYHREQKENIWGNTVTDWVRRNARTILIRNVYSGPGPGTATREGQCTDASSCELKEWAVGFNVKLPADEVSDLGPGATLDLEKVDGTVTVTLEHDVITGEVSASSAFSDSGIW
jgi:hypothetical protein